MVSNELKSRLIALYCQMQELTFNRQYFDENFEKLIQSEAGLLQEISRLCEESDEDLAEICACVPEYVSERLNQISSKRKRNMKALDYKMNMVSYFLPLMSECPGEKRKIAAVKMTDAWDESLPEELKAELENKKKKIIGEEMVEAWNRIIPEYKIGYTNTDSIRNAFKKTPCYITTAVCESRALPDDCYELTLLRKYRDNYLMKTKTGRQAVERYYDIAPTIVKHINDRENCKEIYEEIWITYLKPCVAMLEQNRLKECQKCYTDMVLTLEKEYLHTKEENVV